ncbi:MAG: hypothetical protein HXS50_02115 [Theionarchaea archaeon]|nr:hypothetical protein [Theionarchaea archaeon]
MADELRCKDCKYWYGAEDEGVGPCSLKHQREDVKYLTWGVHLCDEQSALIEYEIIEGEPRGGKDDK